jgi:hypothetical protein
MGSSRDQIVRRILRDHRHLMTEAERRADRAFAFQGRADAETNPLMVAEMSNSVTQALSDDDVRELYQKGRARFLEDMTQRVLAEHGPRLPRCEACGEVLKQPNPRDCFDCKY